MAIVDDSVIVRELAWCNELASELQRDDHPNLTDSERAALELMKLAVRSAAEVYQAIFSYVRDGSSGTKNNPSKMRKMVNLQGQLLATIAKRGRLQMSLAKDQGRAAEADAIFDRISKGELIANAFRDALPI